MRFRCLQRYLRRGVGKRTKQASGRSLRITFNLFRQRTTLTSSVLSAEDAIRDRLFEWAETYKRGDLSGHVDFYAEHVDQYFRKKSVSREFVLDDKKRGLQIYPRVAQFDVEEVQISLLNAQLATSEFVKVWDVRGRVASAGENECE